MLVLSVSLVLLSFLPAPIQGTSVDPPKGKLLPDDYDLYSAAINHLYVSDRIKLIVISDETEEKQPLTMRFNLKVNYVLAKKENLSALLYNGESKAFYNQYPHSSGYLILSTVYFNAQLNEADVEIERHCGFLCAEGISVKLAKNDGSWVVVKEEVIWQS